MLMHPCPRCKALVPYGQTYCPECAAVAADELEDKLEHNRREKARKYNRRRDPKYAKFYRSKAWKMMSRAKLQDVKYKCEAGFPCCQKLAVEVHHIQAIQTPEGWERRLDWDNLEALCTACHNARHQRFRKYKETSDVIDLAKIEKEISRE